MSTPRKGEKPTDSAAAYGRPDLTIEEYATEFFEGIKDELDAAEKKLADDRARKLARDLADSLVHRISQKVADKARNSAIDKRSKGDMAEMLMRDYAAAMARRPL